MRSIDGPCAHAVPQDLHTGADGTIEGATPIAVDAVGVTVHGIVTYPGGDRVDWKAIELPAGKRGRLDIAMTYTTPRSGLRVAYDVFDRWHRLVDAPGVRRHSSTVADAAGTYFVRVYAPRRSDAGSYKLRLAFAEAPPPAVHPAALEVPDPPRLPEVPAEVSRWCKPFDAANPACAKECPFDAPPRWQPCLDRDRLEEAWRDYDRRVVQVEAQRAQLLADAPQPRSVRYVGRVEDDTGVELTVKLDTGHGVTKAWRIGLVDEAGRPLGGTVRITSLGRTTLTIHVDLRSPTVMHASVRLEPPPPVLPPLPTPPAQPRPAR